MDDETSVGRLREMERDFVRRRQWERFHTPKNLAGSMAIEVAELMEHFQWLSVEESLEYVRNPEHRASVADEVADVLIYLLSFANATGIDLSDAVVAKMTRNELRFPEQPQQRVKENPSDRGAT